jgi:Ca2+-binding EF-hand superfamily protein
MPFISDDEIREMFTHFDDDGNSQIDYEELIKIFQDKNYQTAKEELHEIKQKIEKKSVEKPQ